MQSSRPTCIVPPMHVINRRQCLSQRTGKSQSVSQERIQGSDPAMAPLTVSRFGMDLGSTPEKETIFSLNVPNFGDYFVEKVVSEIRKCRQLQEDFVPLTP